MYHIHDSEIYSYAVDFENGRLRISARYYHDNTHSDADIIFSGYHTHLFNNEQKRNIVFDITKCNPVRFYERERALLEENRAYHWPIPYKTPNTKTELLQFLQKNEYTVFEISASQGLFGWIIATEMNIVPQTPPPPQER